ncbi:hypothetical protein JCM3765_003720 [Sporobolomyces pararoseus]
MNPLALEFIPSKPLQSVVEAKKRDHFSPLPPELLDSIFDLAHASSPLIGPISGSLASFWRARRFARVEIKGYKQLVAFANNVSVGTLALVRHLLVAIPPFPHGLTARLDDFNNPALFKEMEVPGYYRENSIKVLFRNLLNVKTLSLSGSSRVARLILSPDIAVTSFPKLSALSIKSTFEGLNDPFHPAHFASLFFYDELTILEISAFRTESSIHSSKKENPTLTPDDVVPLASLQLAGPISASEGAHPLLFLLPAAITTALQDSAQRSRIQLYLDVIFSGTLELIIHASVQIPLPLDAFVRIDNLRYLALFGELAPTESRFYDLLAKMPLVCLQFGGGNELSTNGLIGLVSGSKRSSTLETMVIDEVMIGHALDGSRVEAPAYTRTFTREGFERLMSLGKTAGVEIIGKAVEAFQADPDGEEIMHVMDHRAISLIQALFLTVRNQGRGGGVNGGGQRGRGRGRGRGNGRGGRGRRNGRAS